MMAFVEVMDAETLDLAIPVMQALAATPGLRGTPSEAGDVQDRARRDEAGQGFRSGE